MPWDATRLVVSRRRHADGRRRRRRRRESICQAAWAPDGSLWFSGDRSGFWSLYRWTAGDRRRGDGRARPRRRLPALGVRRVVLRVPRRRAGRVRVRRATGSHQPRRPRAPTAAIDDARAAVHVGRTALRATARTSLFVGAVADDRGRTSSPSPVDGARRDRRSPSCRRATSASTTRGGRCPSRSTSRPADGAVAHALLYRPRNPTSTAPAGRAPAAARGDPRRPDGGGPGHAAARRTSTGRAAASPSSTSTTAARPATAGPTATCCSGQWGDRRRRGLRGRRPVPRRARRRRPRPAVHPRRVGRRVHDARRAGVPGRRSRPAPATTASPTSARWPRDTHKFESRYLDGLVGPWPEAQDVYEARSPIFHVDGIDRPLVVFQGLEDEVVPPNQSRDDRRRRARQGRARSPT